MIHSETTVMPVLCVIGHARWSDVGAGPIVFAPALLRGLSDAGAGG
jgi:hypothetical protein